MKKISLILMICLILITGCSTKEGFTTFGALQNKIDDYLINVDVSEDVKTETQVNSEAYGDGSLVGYKANETNTYLYANLELEDVVSSYEVFYIDESLTYAIFIITEYETNSEVEKSVELIEYIVLDGELAILDTELNALVDIENAEEIIDLMLFLENEL